MWVRTSCHPEPKTVFDIQQATHAIETSIKSNVNQKSETMPVQQLIREEVSQDRGQKRPRDRYVWSIGDVVDLRKLSYSASELLQAAKDTITTGYTTRLIQKAVRPQALARSEASKCYSTYQTPD